jgi:hypothetical protein
MGITLNGFAKNIAQDIAIDAARYGALADQTVEGAEAHAYDEIDGVLGKSFSIKVVASKNSTDSSCYVEVSVTLSTIPIGFLKTASEIKEMGFATCELSR